MFVKVVEKRADFDNVNAHGIELQQLKSAAVYTARYYVNFLAVVRYRGCNERVEVGERQHSEFEGGEYYAVVKQNEVCAAVKRRIACRGFQKTDEICGTAHAEFCGKSFVRIRPCVPASYVPQRKGGNQSNRR